MPSGCLSIFGVQKLGVCILLGNLRLFFFPVGFLALVILLSCGGGSDCDHVPEEQSEACMTPDNEEVLVVG